MQGTWVQSPLREDSTYLRTTRPMCCNYWTHTLEPTEACTPQFAPLMQLEKVHLQQWRPRQSKINKYIILKKRRIQVQLYWLVLAQGLSRDCSWAVGWHFSLWCLGWGLRVCFPNHSHMYSFSFSPCAAHGMTSSSASDPGWRLQAFINYLQSSTPWPPLWSTGHIDQLWCNVGPDYTRMWVLGDKAQWESWALESGYHTILHSVVYAFTHL